MNLVELDTALRKLRFLGIMQLREMTGAEEGEVWYELTRRLDPRKRLKKLVPPESQLEVCREPVAKRRVPK